MGALVGHLPWGCGAVIALLMFGFREVEHLAKPPFRQLIATAIRSSSLFAVGKMAPDFCLNAFDTIFTGKLLSFRGFGRSCVASLAVVATLGIIWYHNVPEEWTVRITNMKITNSPATEWWLVFIRNRPGQPRLDIDMHGHLVGGMSPGTSHWFPLQLQPLISFVYLPFLYNIFGDYVSLLIVRRALQNIERRKNREIGFLLGRLLGIAVCLLLMSAFLIELVTAVANYFLIGHGQLMSAGALANIGTSIPFVFYKANPDEWKESSLYGVFIWSTLMGIFWVTAFSASVLIANVSLRLEKLGPWLDANLRVRTHPFRLLRDLCVALVVLICLFSMLL